MNTWVQAVVPLVVAAITVSGVWFADGAEGRKQRTVLRYLEIADRLGDDTAEGREAHTVAKRATADLLERRGILATQVQFLLGFFGSTILASIFLTGAIAIYAAGTNIKQWIWIGIHGIFAAIFFLLGVYSLVRAAETYRLRQKQRPKRLVEAGE